MGRAIPLVLKVRVQLLNPPQKPISTLPQALAARDVPIPPHIDIYLLDKEIAASDMTALDAVIEASEEKVGRACVLPAAARGLSQLGAAC
jgi:hypothetical protein